MIKDKQLKEKIGIETRQDILEDPHKPVYLGIGSNVGNRIKNINYACYLLNNFCSIYKISNYYETNSWPNENYPKYLNIVLKCKTNLNPFALIKKLNNGILDNNFVIDWDVYKNKILLVDGDSYREVSTRLYNIKKV